MTTERSRNDHGGRVAHWNHIYSTKQSDEVSWYQPEPTISLQLIDRLELAPDT